jgi:hypothetical protein
MITLRLLYTVDEESDVVPVIPYEDGDELIHSAEHPNCGIPGCPCGDGDASITTDDEDEEEVQE